MQQRKKIWLASELYYPETASTGFLLTGIAEGLTKSHRVGVICAQPSYNVRGIRAPWRESHNGVDIRRCVSTTFNKLNAFGRLINLITVSLSLFLRALILIRRHDVVIVVTNPPALPYLIALACRMRGAKLVLLVHDVYPEVLTRVNMAKASSLPVRLMEKASIWLYNTSNRIVALGDDMQKLVAAKLSVRKDRVIVIPNWGETETIYPMNAHENGLRARLGLQEKFVLQYSGNIGRTHGIEDLVEAAERLKMDERVQFVIIGQGQKRAWLLAEKQRRGLTNVMLLDHLPAADLCESLNACDLAVISFSPGMSGISVPSRMYNVLAAGKPLLAVCDADSELSKVVHEERIGWVVPPQHVSQLVDTIRGVCHDPTQLSAMGARARTAAESKYTRAHIIDAYNSLIESL